MDQKDKAGYFVSFGDTQFSSTQHQSRVWEAIADYDPKDDRWKDVGSVDWNIPDSDDDDD